MPMLFRRFTVPIKFRGKRVMKPTPLIGILLCSALLSAQSVPPTDEKPPQGIISGTVIDAGSGEPLENVNIEVRQVPAGQNRFLNTAADGTFKAPPLPKGRYRVRATRAGVVGPVGKPILQYVNLNDGGHPSLSFALDPLAEISGRVLDVNREPIPNVHVYLLLPRYQRGTTERVETVTHIEAYTDDLGKYLLEGVEPDRNFLIFAEKQRGNALPGIAKTPRDPALRRPVDHASFYPSSIAPDGAQPVKLRSGERRENVDIVLARSPSFCIEGQATPGEAYAPASLMLDIGTPESGDYNDRVNFYNFPRYDVTPDGRVRICDLAPTTYSFYVEPVRNQQIPEGLSPFYGEGTFTIVDQDLPSLPVVELKPTDLLVEAVFDPPMEVPEGAMPPRMNAGFASDRGNRGQSIPIPGEVLYPQMPLGPYTMVLTNIPGGAYLKETIYREKPIALQHLDHTTGVQDPPVLQIVLGRDGGTVTVHVQDRDGPVPNQPVLLIPTWITHPGEIFSYATECLSEDDGTCNAFRFRLSSALPAPVRPGEYYVVATELPYSASAEDIDRVWNSLQRFDKILVPPNGMVDITVKPATLN